MIRQLEIIGEAVKNLSTELTTGEATVPWRQIAGTRDRLIHAYFSRARAHLLHAGRAGACQVKDVVGLTH